MLLPSGRGRRGAPGAAEAADLPASARPLGAFLRPVRRFLCGFFNGLRERVGLRARVARRGRFWFLFLRGSGPVETAAFAVT